jgi:hypothetical protein
MLVCVVRLAFIYGVPTGKLQIAGLNAGFCEHKSVISFEVYSRCRDGWTKTKKPDFHPAFVLDMSQLNEAALG